MMKTGTYIRGWKHNWQAGKEAFDAHLAAGRELAAASCADPGVVFCPTCGCYAWREFEVFECGNCGAEVVVGAVTTAGPAKYPDKLPLKLCEGLRVMWLPVTPIRRGRPNLGQWRAGPVPIGTKGTVHADPDVAGLWHVVWDGLIAREGLLWGLCDTFLGEDFIPVA